MFLFILIDKTVFEVVANIIFELITFNVDQNWFKGKNSETLCIYF